MDKQRFALVAAKLKAHVLSEIDPLAGYRALVAKDPDGPTQCKCGARHLKGENHVCNDKVKYA